MQDEDGNVCGGLHRAQLDQASECLSAGRVAGERRFDELGVAEILEDHGGHGSWGDPDVETERALDYLRVPPERPEHWPAILPNSARLSRFVYNGTRDILRGVSKHVTIGQAMKGGKPMSAWFVLCRDDES